MLNDLEVDELFEVVDELDDNDDSEVNDEPVELEKLLVTIDPNAPSASTMLCQSPSGNGYAGALPCTPYINVIAIELAGTILPPILSPAIPIIS